MPDTDMEMEEPEDEVPDGSGCPNCGAQFGHSSGSFIAADSAPQYPSFETSILGMQKCDLGTVEGQKAARN